MADASAASTSSAAAAAQQNMLVKLSTDGVPKLFCPICNKALVSLAGYVKHVKKHDPPGGFICRYCDSRFCSDEELKKHRETEHTTIACRLCKDTTFTNEDDYRSHIRDIHQGVDREIFTCEKCGAAYKTIDPYRRHMETECGRIKPYKCDKCQLAFVTKYNLKQHLDNHSGELKFCCSYCGRNFKQKARLVEHERTHTGEKPYSCDVCGKSFSHRESIVTHSSIHTGIRLVECKGCTSRFSCYSNLIKHRRNRPDTCGLPQFDPPRNRIRKHTSRIPATLNPTSEIKVVNVNKIIKPDDQVKVANLKKESPNKPASSKPVKTKPTARKRTGPAPAPQTAPPTLRKRSPRKKIVDFDLIEDEDLKVEELLTEDMDDDDDYLPLKPKQKTELKTQEETNIPPPELGMSDKPLQNQTTTQWSDDSEDEYVPDFEPADSDTDDEEDKALNDFKIPLPTAGIKQENYDDEDDLAITTNIQIEPLGEFEYTRMDSYTAEVKYEDEKDNLFDEKDRILEHLLNENDYTALEELREDKSSPEQIKRKRARKTCESKDSQDTDDILKEAEVAYIKYEDSDELEEAGEDILEEKYKAIEATQDDIKACYVLLEDVSNCFPALKEGPSVKVPRNFQPFFSKSEKIKKFIKKRGKYRPRRPKAEPGSDEDNKAGKSYRLASISAKQLRERMKLLKRRDKSWQCADCIKIYYMRKPYEKHLRDDHKKSEEFIKEVFKNELDDVQTDDVFKCHICDKIYLMEKRLLSHIPKHGADGSLIHKCPCYCTLYFATREEATAHAHDKHKDMLWCEICEKFMTGCDALKSHKARIHGGNKDYKNNRNLICMKCGKKFLGRTQLTDHERSDCGRLPLYQCQECGKCLTTAGILKTHMLLHNDARPYQCDKCGKTFKIKAQYKTHIKYAHTDEKRFKCHLCPKEYPYRESLLTHMSVHTGIKRFMCNGCGKRFTCVSNLQAHRKVQAESCGQLPLNAKATQYMGVQKGNLLMGAKPEPGLDYVETRTFVAKDVITHDLPMAQELNNQARNMQQDGSLSDGVPLNYVTSGSEIMLMYNRD
ncbi:zinc finger protein 699 [Calliphora vicina]|uniref:zinc finger protein 699 n=1 Tax=Calliphora vicina TaxID=7373 RepID=UPI00325B2F98